MVHQWKLGEDCFIVDMSVGDTHANMRVMPATVTHIGGTDGTHVTATAYSTQDFGKQFIEGRPFPSEKEAREWLRDYANRILTAAENAPTNGMRPGWNIPECSLRNGDTIYVIDVESREILEAKVGILQFEGGRLKVGYDESLGNPEANNIRAKIWFATRVAAEIYIQQNHGEGWAFVSEEQLAARTNAAIDKIWTDAEVRMKSPDFQTQMSELVQALRES